MPTTTTDITEAVTAALRARPEATVIEVAETAGVGRSTAAKCLAALEASGAARRIAGGRAGGRRVADRWAPAAQPAGRSRRGDADGHATGHRVDSNQGNEVRLAKGELSAAVLEHLGAHPEDLGPTAVAKALGRSAGAVANALQRLQADGQVRLVGESPRRYRIAGR